jgi:hypothetical protein
MISDSCVETILAMVEQQTKEGKDVGSARISLQDGSVKLIRLASRADFETWLRGTKPGENAPPER